MSQLTEVLPFSLQVGIEDVDLVLGELDVLLIRQVSHLAVLSRASLDSWHPLPHDLRSHLVLSAKGLSDDTSEFADLEFEHVEFPAFLSQLTSESLRRLPVVQLFLLQNLELCIEKAELFPCCIHDSPILLVVSLFGLL